MKRLLFLSVLLMSVVICGTALADDISGEYASKDGVITIKKAADAHLVRATFKNGHISEYVTNKKNDNWASFTSVRKADNAYYVKIKSAKGDCDYEGLTILQGNELTVDDDLTYPIFSIFLNGTGITPNIPSVSGGDICSYMGLESFKKK